MGEEISSKIVVENEEYFLEVDSGSKRAQKFPLGPIVGSTLPKEAIGNDVELIMSSEERPFVVGVKLPDIRCYLILCYFPRDIFGQIEYGRTIPLIDNDARTKIAQRLLDENVITTEDYDRMVKL
jgi:hypothetical protein